MGQVINFLDYKRARNVGSLNRINQLKQELADAEYLLRTSLNVHVRENAAIDIGVIRIELRALVNKLGNLQ